MNDLAISAGDTAWLMTSTALVLLMVPGLAFFYGGLVRSKGSLNTMMMSLAMLGLVGVQWLLVGYSLAFEPGGPFLGGLSWVGLRGIGPGRRRSAISRSTRVATAWRLSATEHAAEESQPAFGIGSVVR